MKAFPFERRTLGSFLTWRRRRVLVNSLFELLASLITTLHALAPCIVLHTDSTVMQDICVTRDSLCFRCNYHGHTCRYAQRCDSWSAINV